MDWSTYRCGRAGHVTYAPDEPELARHVRATAASAELWRCLRCGTFVPGPPDGSGPAASAPPVRRGKEIRGELILRLFAIERFVRFVIFGVASYGIWRFANSRLNLTQAINRDQRVIRDLFHQIGINLNHSGIFHEITKLLHLSPRQLTAAAALIAGLAVISLAEGYALWQAKRWGEYFAMTVTSLGLPFEIFELTKSVTVTKLILFALNIVLVLYLVLTRRLFGVRGGKEAYEARLRAESVLDEAAKAAAAAQAPAPAVAAPGPPPP